MNWTVEQIENVMNYLRVFKDADKIYMFYLDNDVIGYYDTDGKAHQRNFSSIYKEMVDKFNRIMV